MQVIAVQFDITWENPEANFGKVERLLASVESGNGSLVVLPEMFSTGFSMNVDGAAEDEPSQAEAFLSSVAKRYGCWVLGGVVFRGRSGLGRNCIVVFGPDGRRCCVYQKNYSFSFAGEHEHFESGDESVVFDWGGVSVCPAICYDLRFPELFRRGVKAGAELFVVSANWPASRIEHWKALLKARAIENQAVMVGVNRVGLDPNINYNGGSMIVDAEGNVVGDAGTDQGCLAVDIDPQKLRDWRARFPALRDIK